MEDVPTCCLCGSDGCSSLFAVRDRLYDLAGEFALVRCTSCGLIRLSPRPTPETLPSYYPEESYYAYRETSAPTGPPPVRGLRTRLRDGARAAALSSIGYPSDDLPPLVTAVGRRWTTKSLLRLATYGNRGFPDYVSGGRALDVGCGNGAFLALLARHGWNVVGVDASPAASRAAAAQGVEVHVGDLQSAGLAPRSFAYIRMSHSIEHVWDPVDTLRTAYELLEPGGRIFVETPNIGSLLARKCGTYWYPLETPRHLWLFDPQTLKRSLSTAGFDVTSVDSKSFGGRPLSALRWESTYRAEEAQGHLLAHRPVLDRQDLARAIWLEGAAAASRLVHPDNDEIVYCWARRPLDS
jgi:SAM-dependent methyltransferase